MMKSTMTETCSAVLRSRRNCSSDGAERTDDGRAFHARAAVTGNARSPSVVRRVDGMTGVDVEARRMRRHSSPVMSNAGARRRSIVASDTSKSPCAAAASTTSAALRSSPFGPRRSTDDFRQPFDARFLRYANGHTDAQTRSTSPT